MLTSSRIGLSGIFVAITQHYDMTPFRGVLDGIMGQDLSFLRVRFQLSWFTRDTAVRTLLGTLDLHMYMQYLRKYGVL